MNKDSARAVVAKIGRVFRDAITGRFVTRLFAKNHPDTTVSERRERK